MQFVTGIALEGMGICLALGESNTVLYCGFQIGFKSYNSNEQL